MKLFPRSILSVIAITAVAPLASGQTPLYYQGGIILNTFAERPTGPGDENFNTPSNWSTMPPSTFLMGTTSTTFPQANNIAVIQADLNNGTVYYTSQNSAFLSGNAAKPVIVNQTSQGNTVAGFLVSNYGFVGQGSGIVDFTNSSGQFFTVNPATSVSTGDFVVDGGVTLNYGGGPFAVANGLTVIGDDETFNTGANNTVGGSGTFNVQSGLFSFDATGTTTSMIVGDSQSGNGSFFFGTANGTVTQGANAIAAGTNPITPAVPATASSVVLGSSLIIGFNGGAGTWTLTNGSSLSTGTLASSYLIALGSNGGRAGLTGVGSKGTLTISDNSGFSFGTIGSAKATDLQLGTVSVGAAIAQGGTGSIVQNGVGSVVNLVGTATTVEIGDLGGGTGSYSLSNGTLNIGVNATDHVTFVLGASAGSNGTLTQTGGVINYGNAGVTNGSTFVIGGAGANSGTFTMTGGSDTFNNSVVLNGTLNVNGGTFAIDQAKLTGAGTLNLGGGTLKFTGPSAIENFGFVGNLTGGTSTIDASTSGITTFNFTHTLAGAGGINLIGNNVVGAGTTVFNFAAAGNTYSGSTGISGGTLNATGEDFSTATAGTKLTFGTAATAAATVLNLTVDANTILPQAISGSGQLNIIYTHAGTNTLTLANTTSSISNVNVAIGAAGGNAGTFQTFGGSFGTVVDNGTGSSVIIGGGGSAGTVTFGTTAYSGLTTVTGPATLVAGNLQGSVVNSGTLLVTNNIGSSAANTVTNTGTLTAANIVGNVTNNTGPLTLTGAAGLAGNVLANTGTITVRGAAGITGNVMNDLGGTVIDSGGIGGNVTNLGTLSARSALSMNNTGSLKTAAPLTNFAITNGFTQNAGGSFSIAIAGAQSDSFSAATANLTGTVLVTGASLSTTVPTLYNIVTTTGGITPNPTTLVTQNSFLLNTSLAIVGNDLVLSVTTNPFVGSTPNQQALATVLNANPNNPITVAVTSNPNLTAADEAGILQSLIPENLQYARFINIENVNYMVQRIDGVNADLRNGNGGLDTNAISVSMPGFQSGMGRSLGSMLAYNDPAFHESAPNGVNYYPGEAGRNSPSPSAHSNDAPEPATFDSSSQVISDSPNPYLADVKPGTSETPRLNEFIGGDVILADLNQNPSANANDKASYTAGDVTAGVSYRVTNHFAAGVLFDYNHTDADTDNNGGKTKIDSYTPGIFATFFDKGFYVNGLFTVGLNDYKYTSNTFLGQTSGSPTGEQYTGNLDAGYDFHPTKNWIVGPTAGLTYTHIDIDSFTEDGAPGAALNVDSQSVDSLRSRLGGHVVFQTNTGDVLLQPSLSLMWQHEFLNDSDGITSSFANTSLNPFTIETAAPSRDSALIGLGMTATLSNSMALYLNYMADVGASNYFSQSVYGGIKARF